ncbi:hypothetical protein LXT21_12635 [Myxococcus sp. K38C18041901]|uniref:hypothetical protein n=1 Tax=Myxococcus guangdongensis TaxID=2906760 RepID=UPI0020A82E9E|nr:hypothetical protein [Myxococcus guangdongensis]MCP3059625.1 hypothetical protein [Myxococcus guangdongensis]
MERRRWLMMGAVLGFVLAMGFALGVGFAGRSRPETVVAAAPTSPPPPVAPTEQAHRLLQDEELKNVQLRQRITELQRELQRVRESSPDGGASTPVRIAPREAGTFRAASPGAGSNQPLAFPQNAPEQFTPKGFEKVAIQAAKECGMGLDVIAVDCSEFPCIAWTEAKDATIQRFTMDACSPWAEAFKYGTVVVGSIDPSDGGSGARFFSWMAVPPDPTDLLIAVKRAKERNREMKMALGIP